MGGCKAVDVGWHGLVGDCGYFYVGVGGALCDKGLSGAAMMF